MASISSASPEMSTITTASQRGSSKQKQVNNHLKIGNPAALLDNAGVDAANHPARKTLSKWSTTKCTLLGTAAGAGGVGIGISVGVGITTAISGGSFLSVLGGVIGQLAIPIPVVGAVVGAVIGVGAPILVGAAIGFFSGRADKSKQTSERMQQLGDGLRLPGAMPGQITSSYALSRQPLVSCKPFGNKVAGLVEANRAGCEETIPPFVCLSIEMTSRLLDFPIPLNGVELPRSARVGCKTAGDIARYIRQLQHRRQEARDQGSDASHVEEEMLKCGKCLRELLTSDECITYFATARFEESGDLRSQLDELLNPIRNEGYDLLAVRSSSSEEDTDQEANAGLYETKIGVDASDITAVLKAIAKVKASEYSDKALLRNVTSKDQLAENGMGVMLQGLFRSSVSGVVYSKSPTDYNKAVITFGPGQGEGTVSGILSGMSVKVSRSALDKVVNNGASLHSLRLEIAHTGSYRKYVWIDERGKKQTKNLPANEPITMESMAKFLSRSGSPLAPSDLEWRLEMTLKQILVNSYRSELKHGGPRDREFGISGAPKDGGLECSLLQDRALIPPRHRIILRPEDAASLKANAAVPEMRVECSITNGWGVGKLIREQDFLRLNRNQQHSQKYIILADHADESLTDRLDLVAGVIAVHGRQTDHMSNVLEGRGIPLITLSNQEDLTSLIEQHSAATWTLANVVVGGQLQSLLLNGNHSLEIGQRSVQPEPLRTRIQRLGNPSPYDAELNDRATKCRDRIENSIRPPKNSPPITSRSFGKVDAVAGDRSDRREGEEFTKKFGWALELNHVLLEQCASLSECRLLRELVPELFTSDDYQALADYLRDWNQPSHAVRRILDNLDTFVEFYIQLVGVNDRDNQKLRSGLAKVKKEAARLCDDFCSHVKGGNLTRAGVSLDGLKELLFDNGPGEEKLSRKSLDELNVQEIIRVVHRRLYTDLPRFLKKHGKEIGATVQSEDSPGDVHHWTEIGNPAPYLESLSKKVRQNCIDGKGISELRGPNLWVLDVKLNFHSMAVTARIDDSKRGGDSNRIDVAMVNPGARIGSVFRSVYLEQMVEQLQRSGKIGSGWKCSHDMQTFRVYRDHFDFSDRETIKQLEDELANLTKVIALCVEIDFGHLIPNPPIEFDLVDGHVVQNLWCDNEFLAVVEDHLFNSEVVAPVDAYCLMEAYGMFRSVKEAYEKLGKIELPTFTDVVNAYRVLDQKKSESTLMTEVLIQTFVRKTNLPISQWKDLSLLHEDIAKSIRKALVDEYVRYLNQNQTVSLSEKPDWLIKAYWDALQLSRQNIYGAPQVEPKLLERALKDLSQELTLRKSKSHS